MSLEVYFTTYQNLARTGSQYEQDEQWIRSFDDNEDESLILSHALSHIHQYGEAHRLAFIYIRDGSDNLVKKYKGVPGSTPMNVVPADVDTGAYRALLTEDKGNWDPGVPMWEDTATGIDDAVDGQYYFPGHEAQVLMVYNDGTAISKGELLMWVAASDPDQHDFVQIRNSDSVAPCGVALEDIAADTWGKMAVAGHCDVLADSVDTGKNAAWYCDGTNDEKADKDVTEFFLGLSCAPTANDGSEWVRLYLNMISTAVDEADVYVDDDGFTAVLSGAGSSLQAMLSALDSHVIESHSDVTIASIADLEIFSWDAVASKWINRTAAELGLFLTADIDDTPVNGVTDAPISSNWAYDHVNDMDAHHKPRGTLHVGQRNTDSGSDYWDVSELNSGLSGYRAYTMTRAGSIIGFGASFYFTSVSSSGDYELEIYKATSLGSGGAMLLEEVTAVSSAQYYQVYNTYSSGTYTFAAGDMLVVYGRFTNGLAGSWRQGVGYIELEFDT